MQLEVFVHSFFGSLLKTQGLKAENLRIEYTETFYPDLRNPQRGGPFDWSLIEDTMQKSECDILQLDGTGNINPSPSMCFVISSISHRSTPDVTVAGSHIVVPDCYDIPDYEITRRTENIKSFCDKLKLEYNEPRWQVVAVRKLTGVQS